MNMIGNRLKRKLDQFGEDVMENTERYHCRICDINWTDVPYKAGNAPTCPSCDDPVDSEVQNMNEEDWKKIYGR